MSKLITGRGVLTYGPGIRAILEIDKEIGKYYYNLIPKYKNAQSQCYPAHLTVIRLNIEHPDLDYWGKYDGEEIEFKYENEIKFKEPYYYLDAWSDRIGDIREEMGLPRYRNNYSSYHISIGNSKNERSNQSREENCHH